MHKSLHFLIFLLLSASTAFAQNFSTKNKKAIDLYLQADNFRVRGQFPQAIKLLQQAIEKDNRFEEAYYRLGAIYERVDRRLASTAFEQGLKLASSPVTQKAYRWAMGENYLRSGFYDLAKASLEGYLVAEKTDKVKIDKALLWKSQAEFALAHTNVNAGYIVKPLSDTVNKFPMQYFPVVTADQQQLFFTRRLGTGADDEDIVVSQKNNGRWTSPNPISQKINTKSNEGSCSVSADGRYMIFVAGDINGHTDLYEARKVGDDWSQPRNLGANINSPYWDSQPSLSADGQELYFVSARKGGIGGSDIWYSRKDSVGKWMRAVNLGNTINTKFDEESPFIHVNNRNLFYASNGLPGFGGYDIYMSELGGSGWQQPTNLGAPLNDYEDQFSFVVTSDGKSALYSREEAGMKSKIYQTSVPKEFQIKSKGNVVKGFVVDAQSKKPIGSEVELFDLKTNKRISVYASDSINGNYLIVIPGKSEYALHVSEPGYLFYSLHFNYEVKDQEQPLIINIALQPIQKNAVTILNNIFFESNKYEVTAKSIPELEEVVKFLNANPSTKVEISGHTDNVGDEKYNQLLSQKRAQSVIDYFLNKGIASDRLTKIGYGSKSPIQPNDTEEHRQANRRIEFKIL